VIVNPGFLVVFLPNGQVLWVENLTWVKNNLRIPSWIGHGYTRRDFIVSPGAHFGILPDLPSPGSDNFFGKPLPWLAGFHLSFAGLVSGDLFGPFGLLPLPGIPCQPNPKLLP